MIVFFARREPMEGEKGRLLQRISPQPKAPIAAAHNARPLSDPSRRFAASTSKKANVVSLPSA